MPPGVRSPPESETRASCEVERGADSIDYVDVTDADSLAPFPEGAKVAGRALVAIACRLGATRLIDNVVLGEDPSPVPR